MFRNDLVVKLLMGCLMLALSGCAKEAPKLRVLYPPPPAQPKYEFIKRYAHPGDFKAGKLDKFLREVGGERPLASFQTPMDALSSGDGRVFVSDLHARNVHVVDYNKRTVDPLVRNKNYFATPIGLAFDDKERIHVVDAERRRVTVFGRNLKRRREIDLSQHMKLPNFLVFHSQLQRWYVSDGMRNKINVFDADWKWMFDFAKVGKGPGDVYGPSGLAVSPQGQVYVADGLNARIQVFEADGSYVRQISSRGTFDGQLESPKDLAFDSDGNLYVVDARRPAFYVFNQEGRLLLAVGERNRRMPFSFDSPGGIWIDDNDRIYIADRYGHTLLIWQYLNKRYWRENPISPEDMQRYRERSRQLQ